MKRKIVIGLSIFSLIFLAGGIYIALSVEKATMSLNKLVTLHEVEILRKNLFIRIGHVQSDLSLKHTRHARDVSIIVRNVREMSDTANQCFGCHHSEEVVDRLMHIRAQIEQYKEAISRALTVRAMPERTGRVEDTAITIGEELATNVSQMLEFTSKRLQEKTRISLREINATKTILFVLVSSGPFLAIGLAIFFIRSFTRPVDRLLSAIRSIKGGDLAHRIDGLEDEFGEVASSFNDMALSVKEYIEKIRESEKQYRALFENAGDAIFIIDAGDENAGRIVAANRAAADMHGFSVEELLAMNISDLDVSDKVSAVGSMMQLIQEGEWIKLEQFHRRKDGSYFPVEISAGPLELRGRRYLLAFDRDITERKRSEEIQQRGEQLKQVGELAAGLAHEIKNPLAAIKVSIEVLLQEAPLSGEDRGVLLRVVDEIRRIEMSIRDLLNFAKPPKPQYSPVNLNTVIERAMSLLLRSLDLSYIDVHKDYGRVPETMADPMQLQQVFLNLVINAAESMPGGGTLTVMTAFDEAGNSLIAEVSDTGRGIDADMQNKIFNPFFTTKPKGTGLGLSITKRLIEQQGGTVSAANNSDKGAVFRVVLPVRTVEEVQRV